MPVWFTALENHGPFPGPPPAANADEYLREDGGTGGAGGCSSPRSVYGGSVFNSNKFVQPRSPSKANTVGAMQSVSFFIFYFIFLV